TSLQDFTKNRIDCERATGSGSSYQEISLSRDLKRRCVDDADKDEEPSDGPDRGSKRHREGKEPESASAPLETATRKEPVQTTFQMEEPSHQEFETGAKDQPIVQSSQHLEWFSQQ
nr:hypothetical protein [Tanacetum cinerariifolium]